MKNNALKIKIIMITLLLVFMFFYMVVFGSKNAAIGFTIVLAAFMNAGDDFSYKPKLSFFKVLGLLLVLCIAAYLNNPVSIIGCILTFLVVFGTTFTSYHLFSDNVYMPYLPISKTALMLSIFIICICGLVFNLKDKLLMSIFSTVMSIMFSLIYITPTMGITLKILWVGVAVIVVTAINYLFLPYSVEKETKNNLMLRSKLNEDSIDLIRNEKNSSKKTTIMVLSNIVGENIKITDENKELFEVQSKITDVSDFILTYINKHELPDDFKDKLIDVLDNGGEVNVNLDIRYRAILRSTKYITKLFKKEKELIGGI